MGIRGTSLVFLLNALVRDRALREARIPLVDLVWTGPDLPGNPSRDTRIVVHEMFRKAKRSVLVSTYALFDGRTLFDPLHETWQAHPDLTVKLFVDIKHGEMGTPPADTLTKFRHDFKAFHWPWDRLPEVYYDPRSLSTDPAVKSCLHAKCVIVDDREVFLTSANLTEAAQQRNIEAGLVVNSEALATRVRDHFISMVSANLVLALFGPSWPPGRSSAIAG
jgi:phosphatidylserine/phosphatidylglycerophosphate/cardiolipin synthase-like enzyme